MWYMRRGAAPLPEAMAPRQARMAPRQVRMAPRQVRMPPARCVWPPDRRVWPHARTYTPQSRYVPPPPPHTAGTQLITNGPQTNPGDVSPSWSPQRNVAESEQYDRLLKDNSAFRQARMRKECGPINDPQLHQQCIDSFARY